MLHELIKTPDEHECNTLPFAKYFVLSRDKLTIDVHRIENLEVKHSMKVEPKYEIEDTEILYIQSSLNHEKIALLLGRRGIRDSIIISEIQVYKIRDNALKRSSLVWSNFKRRSSF